MFVEDRAYAKKLVNGLASGYLSSTVTDNTDGSKTLTITFVNGDKANITFNPVKGDKGETGTSVQDVIIKEISGVRHLIVKLDNSTEIDAGILPNEQYDDTQIKDDIANLKTDKQDKTDNTLNTTDKTVTGAINETYGNLLDTVGFSADYKNIILNRKNGLNPYTIPISAIIHNAELTELNDIDSTDIGNGKALVYDSAIKKHKYVDSVGTDEFVKMDSTSDSKYLSELIDKNTVVNDNGVLKVKKLDGQEVTITEINYLKGLTMNVMDLANMFANGGVKIINAPVATHADLLAYDKSSLMDGISYLVYVLADEAHNNAKTTYLIDKTSSTPTYFGFADEHRDFVTDPINLANEVTGKLGTSNIDIDALWKLLTINDTYKTLTANNEVFGTHGAKALYDDLVKDIGDKADTTDLTSHTSDTDIHITSAEREAWNNKANDNEVIKKTDITTTIDNTCTDSQIPGAKSVYDNIKSKLDNTIILKNTDEMNSFNRGYQSFMVNSTIANEIGLLDLSNSPASTWFCIHFSHSKGYKYPSQIAFEYAGLKRIMYRTSVNGVWGTWQKVCTTSVADVSKTNIAPADETKFIGFKGNSMCNYCVKNGVCYVSLWNVKVSVAGRCNTGVILPMPKSGFFGGGYLTGGGDAEPHAYAHTIPETGELKINVKDVNVPLYGAFSYPVSES